MEQRSIMPISGEDKAYLPRNNNEDPNRISHIAMFHEFINKLSKLVDGVTKEDIETMEDIIGPNPSRSEDEKIYLALANKMSEEELDEFFSEAGMKELPGYSSVTHGLRNAIFVLYNKTKERKYKSFIN